MKNLLFLSLCFFVLSHSSYAQNFSLPNYQSKEDYAKYQPDVLQAIEWLKTNHLQHDQRKAANVYVLKWAEGSPNVTINMHSYVLQLTEKNKDFLVLYIGGWIQYAVENKDTYNESEANHQAVKTVVEYYQAGNGSVKDPKLEKLLKLHKKGTLKEWVNKHLNG